MEGNSINPPILAFLKKDAPLTIETDACDEQIFCVLLQPQKYDEKDLQRIGYWSRTLNDAGKNYDNT